MVSQRDLNKVVEQINSSYSVLIERLVALEAELASLKSISTNKKESKEKP
jgi:hypothetical protein